MAEKEYIERKDLINNRPPQRNPNQTGKEEYNKGYNDGIKAVLSCIEIQPSADVAPVRHGHWIAQENWTTDDYYYTCSICKEDFYMIVGTPSDNNYKYCPNCGAKLDGNEVE